MRTNNDRTDPTFLAVQTGMGVLLGGAIYQGITIPTLTWGALLGSGSTLMSSFTFWSAVVESAPALIPIAVISGLVVAGLQSIQNQEDVNQFRP